MSVHLSEECKIDGVDEFVSEGLEVSATVMVSEIFDKICFAYIELDAVSAWNLKCLLLPPGVWQRSGLEIPDR